MIRFIQILIFSVVLLVFGQLLSAQDSKVAISQAIVIEAEIGDLGEGIVVESMGEVSYIAPTETQTDPPLNAFTVASYQVTFNDPGNYDLFLRLRVGSEGYNDDSFFAAGVFGDNITNWQMVNGLAAAGFNGSKDVVLDLGTVGSEVWKWVNISQNYFPEVDGVKSFHVDSASLVKTFQIATREDGLFIDKLAFGKDGLFYTVEALDNGLAGTTEMPIDSSLYQGPPIAEGSVKFLGNVKDRGDDNFANIWNQITPGNEGKWASVARAQDTLQWNWSGLDELYGYAQTNGLSFKNHTLIWGAQQPSWINDLSQEEQVSYIETWMRQVGQRYPDMDMIDVVNEAIASHNPPDGQGDRANYKEALGGDGVSGYDWVIKSFELARKYMPENTKLLLNDYGIINDNNATSIYLKMINLLNEKGLIDGIGVQCHRFAIQNASLSVMKNNLDRLAATGLPIYISEMDLGDAPGDDDAPYDDALQLQKYQEVFPIFWEHPSVVGVTLWGSLEGKMWQKTCHVINSDNSWRPALDWIAEYIATTPVEIELVEDTTSAEIAYTYYEVECAQAGENWELFADDLASNGHYLTVKSGVESTAGIPEGEENLIVIPFEVNDADLYSIYGRVNCPSADDDSFWSLVDDEDAQMANGLATSDWEWKVLSSFSLGAGEHTLNIGYREDGALLDKICVTNSSFPPTVMGEIAVNVCDTTVESNSVHFTVEQLLLQNYPNPFSTATTISFRLEKEESVSLEIYDITGHKVATLFDNVLVSGNNEVIWNATSDSGDVLTGGTYFYRLTVGDIYKTSKMLLIK